MQTSMRVISRMEKLMEKVCINGQTVKFMMVNGETVSKKVTGFGKVSLETPILGSGKIVKQMGMEFISGKTVIGMRESGRTV